MKKDNRNHKIQATDRSGKSVYILIASSLRQLSMVILNFVSRTVFIHILGADYLGLNGLFSNILSLLSLTELGIGTAISFYFYKPLAEHDIEQIKSLSHFYKNCYAAIGTIMTVIGLALLPALPYLVNFDQDLPVNLYLVYILYLFNSSASYLFFAYKQGIIAADQKQYIVEKINIAFTFISCLTDIIVLITFRNYIFYLLFKLIITIVKNITIALRVDKEYPYLNDKHYSKISAEDKKTIFKNVGNAAIFKIGSTLFNSTDNIMISVLLGTVLVGYYSNYYLIISQISVVINIAVQSLAAGVGNVMAKENEEKQYAIFKELNFYLMLLTSFCVICLFQLINPFIYIWIGHNNQNYVLSQMTVLFLCWSLYYDGTTQVMNTFREASGNFLIGRTLQLYGGIANIVLDYILGTNFGIEGIFAATVITKGLITVIPFILAIEKNVFNLKGHNLLKRYIIDFCITVIITLTIYVVLHNIMATSLILFVIKMLLTILLATFLLLLFYRRSYGMKCLLGRIRKFKNRNNNSF